MPLEFLPSVDLGGDEIFSKHISDSIHDIGNKLGGIETRVADLNRKFDELQVLADDVAERYEKTARKNGGRIVDGIDRKSLLQPILDHSLRNADVALLCRYIRSLFCIILKLIQNKDRARFAEIRTIVKLHQARANDSALARAYSDVAKYLEIDNSGRPETCLHILHAFLADYKSTTDGGPTRATAYSVATDEEDDVVVAMPTHAGLASVAMSQYVNARIAQRVQNANLAEALRRCVRAVRKVRSADS